MTGVSVIPTQGASGNSSESQTLQALNNIAVGEAMRSVLQHRSSYDEGVSFTEPWTNLAEWVLTEAECVKVSAGKLVGTAKAVPSALHTFSVAEKQRFRIVTSINFVKGYATENQQILVGVSNGTSGVKDAKWTGIGIDCKTGAVRQYAGGVVTNLGAAEKPEGQYLVTIVGDEKNVSFHLIKSDRAAATEDYFFKRTWAQVGKIERAFVFNQDTREAAGSFINPLGTKTTDSTITNRTGVEGIGTSRVVMAEDKNGEAIRLEFPAAFDSRYPPKAWIIFCHGALATEPMEGAPIQDSKCVAMFTSLLNAGFCVASSRMHNNSYGNEQSQTDLLALYEYIRDHYPLAPIIMMPFSAGAAGAIAVIRRKIPVHALCLISSFLNMGFFAEHHGEAQFAAFLASFRAAYGVEESFANYAAQVPVKGLDPMLSSPQSWRGIPVGIFASPEDATISKVQNSEKLKTLLSGSQRLLQEMATTGTHDEEGNFPPAAIKQFCEEAVVL